MSLVDTLLAGISRCNCGEKSCSLEEYYRRWKDEIESHQERDRIIEAFRERKEEIQNVSKK